MLLEIPPPISPYDTYYPSFPLHTCNPTNQKRRKKEEGVVRLKISLGFFKMLRGSLGQIQYKFKICAGIMHVC